MPPRVRLPWRTLAAFAIAFSTLAIMPCGGRPLRELRVVLAEPIVSLDPFLSDAEADRLLQRRSGWGGFTVLFNIHEALVRFREDRKVEPALAAAWHNPDDLTWVFDLRRGVRFHDGSTLTSADVVAVFDKMRTSDALMGPHLRTIESVTAEDEHTVRIKTKIPVPLLLSHLSFVPIKPKASLSAAKPAPNGTGPFRYAGQGADGTHRLEAFADYWHGRSRWDRVTVSVETKPAERLARLVRGEVDFAEKLPPEQLSELQRSPDLAVLTGAARDTVILGFTLRGGAANPFNDPRIREAIDLSIDRPGLVREGHLGFATPAVQLVPPIFFGRIPDLPLVTRDEARARHLLRATPHAKGFTRSLLVETELAVAARIIARDAATVGIGLEVQVLSREDIQLRRDKKQVQAFLIQSRALAPDGSDLLLNYFHTPDPATRRGMLNWCAYSNPEFDELIESALAAPDLSKRLELLSRSMKVAVRSRVMLPLVTRHDAHGGRKGMTFAAEPRGYIRFEDLATGAP